MANCVFAFLTLTLIISTTFSENVELKLSDENSKSEKDSSANLNKDIEITSNQNLDNVKKEVDQKFNKNFENKNTHEPNGKLDEKNEENSLKNESQEEKEEFQVFFSDEDGEDENFKENEDLSDSSLGINDNVNSIDDGNNGIDEKKNSKISNGDNEFNAQNQNSKDSNTKIDSITNDQDNNNEKKRKLTTWEKAELALKKRQKTKSLSTDTTLTTSTILSTFIDDITHQTTDNINDNSKRDENLNLNNNNNNNGNNPIIDIDLDSLAMKLNTIEDVIEIDEGNEKKSDMTPNDSENKFGNEKNIKDDNEIKENIKTDRLEEELFVKETLEEKQEKVKKIQAVSNLNVDTFNDKTTTSPTTTTTTRTSFINRGPSSVITTFTTTTTTTAPTTTTTTTASTITLTTTATTITYTTADEEDGNLDKMEAIGFEDLTLIKQAHDDMAQIFEKDTGGDEDNVGETVDHTLLSTSTPTTTSANSINKDDTTIQSDPTTTPVATTTGIAINTMSKIIEVTKRSDENAGVKKDGGGENNENLKDVFSEKPIVDKVAKKEDERQSDSRHTTKILKLNEIINSPTKVASNKTVPEISQDAKKALKAEDISTGQKDELKADDQGVEIKTVLDEGFVESNDEVTKAKSPSRENVKTGGKQNANVDPQSSVDDAAHESTTPAIAINADPISAITQNESSDEANEESLVNNEPSLQEGAKEKIYTIDKIESEEKIESSTTTESFQKKVLDEAFGLKNDNGVESSISNINGQPATIDVGVKNASERNSEDSSIFKTEPTDGSSAADVIEEKLNVANPRGEADIDDKNNKPDDNIIEKNEDLKNNVGVNTLNSNKNADEVSYRQYEQEAIVNDIDDYDANDGVNDFNNEKDNEEEIEMQKDAEKLNGDSPFIADDEEGKAQTVNTKTPQDEDHFESGGNIYNDLLRAKQEEFKKINNVPPTDQQEEKIDKLSDQQKENNEEITKQHLKDLDPESLHQKIIKPPGDSNINIFNGNFNSLKEVPTGTDNANDNIDEAEIDDVIGTTMKPFDSDATTASEAATITVAPVIVARVLDLSTTTSNLAAETTTVVTPSASEATVTDRILASTQAPTEDMATESSIKIPDDDAQVRNEDQVDQDFLNGENAEDNIDATNEDVEKTKSKDTEVLESGEEDNEDDSTSGVDETVKEIEESEVITYKEVNEEKTVDDVPTKELVGEEKTTPDETEILDEDMKIRELANDFFNEENDLEEKKMQMMGVDVTLKPQTRIHDVPLHQTNPETPGAEFELHEESELSPNKTSEVAGDEETWLTSTLLPYKVMLGLTLQNLDPPITYAISMMPPTVQLLFTHSPFQLYPPHAFILFSLSSFILFSIFFSQGFQVWRSKKKIDEKKMVEEMVSQNQHMLCVMEQEKEDLSKELKSTLKNLATLEESNKARKLETQKINKELKEVLMEKNSLKEKVNKLEQTLNKTEKKLKTQTPNTNNKELEDKLEEASNTVKLLEKQNNELKASLQKSKQSAMQMQSQLEVVNDEISTLQKSKNQLINQAESWTDKVSELMEMVRVSGELEKKQRRVLAKRDTQIEELQQSFKRLDAFKLISVTEAEEDEEEEKNEEDREGGDDNGEVKLERFMRKIEKMIDIVKLNEELQKKQENVEAMKMSLSKEVEDRLKLEEKLEDMSRDLEGVEEEKRSAESQVAECKVKMQVLSEYFRDKENNLNRLLSEKEEKERLTSKNFDQLDERVKQSEKMVALYKEQSEELKKEIKKIETDYKKQIAMQEKKSQENWLLARQSEREAKKLHMEAQMQRQRLLELQEKQDFLKEESTKGSTSGSRPGSRPNIIPFPGFRPGMDRQFRGPSPLLPPFIPPPSRFIPPYSRIREDYMDHPPPDLSPIPYPRTRSPDLSDRSAPRSDSPIRSPSRHSRSPPYRSRSPPRRRSSPHRQGSPYRSPIYRSRSPSFQSDSSGYRKNASNRFSGHLNSEDENLAVENRQYNDNDKKRSKK